MKQQVLILVVISCSQALGGAWSIFQPPQIAAQSRVFFDAIDPSDIFTKWGPFGYFNQYLDPSNAVGPEILKGFGSPFMPYNGYNAMQSITTPPLMVPPEATSTAGYDPDLFAPPSPPSKEPSTTEAPATTPAYKPPNYNNGHPNGYGRPNQMNGFRPQIIRGNYQGPASQFVGYHPVNGYPGTITMDMRRRGIGNNNNGGNYH